MYEIDKYNMIISVPNIYLSDLYKYIHYMEILVRTQQIIVDRGKTFATLQYIELLE